jgi:plastocyanin
MAIRPVNIVGSNPATFEAVLPPKPPVGTVYADGGDIVFWNNASNQTHQISLLANSQKKGGEVTPNHQTDAFQVPQPPAGTKTETTIAYTCLLHPGENAVIKVSKPSK